ncbi:hypothetical protein Vadar_034572 [Vaccinium darrowii]|uniref:Uncharacterized protein n=1 Tax=Vaccinium darrowii TaxID=229202 RepID=A0ACB7YBP6_9ERIC|nr:hypothetical protein Vadar_034572 [Vaccinium darrowii]
MEDSDGGPRSPPVSSDELNDLVGRFGTARVDNLGRRFGMMDCRWHSRMARSEFLGRFGGPGGGLTDKVCLIGPVEQLAALSLTLGDFTGQSVISSLSFHTNLNKYGPFGSKSGKSISIPIEGGVIFGFHGRAGRYLNAIGIYVAPKMTISWQIGGQDSAPTHLKALSSMNLSAQRDPGPWGAQRGRHWDDGFEYEQRDGKPFLSPWHGSLSGGQLHKIELDSPGEIILAIEGFYGPVKGTDGFEIEFDSPDEIILAVNGVYGPVKGIDGFDVIINRNVPIHKQKKGSSGVDDVGFSVTAPVGGGEEEEFTALAIVANAERMCSRRGRSLSQGGLCRLRQRRWGRRSFVVATVKNGGVEDGCISIGPWGRLVGEPWAYKADIGRVTHIIVRHGVIIDSISFQAESCDGFKPDESSDRFGGSGGHLTDKVCLIGPVEQLTAISLTLGEFAGQSVISSLSFHTNLNKYGPFGSKSGKSISIPIEGGVIFGFHGRAGRYLNAIGIYVAPKTTISWPIGDQDSAPTHLKALSSMNLSVQRDPGPWGAQRGRHWDDGVFQAIKQVIVRTGCAETTGNIVIHGIQFEYEQRDGKPFLSPWHGSLSGGQLHKIELDSSGEIILAIEGFYGPVKGTDGFEVITSMSIYTNRRKCGPFGGNEIGTHFSSMLSGGKAVGFFGRSGTYLNAIGLHMEYF